MEKLKRWCSTCTRMRGVYWLLLLLTYVPAFAHDDDNQVEKKKTVSFSYPVSSADKISLNNQFGDIKVSFWDKKEVRVEIFIIANASSEERATDFINTVNVSGKKEEGMVFVKTNIERSSNRNWSNKGDKHSLKIDYAVFMPKSNALQVKNSFGNVYLPTFSTPLRVDQSYGKLVTEDILTPEADINLAFCPNSYIKSMVGGRLKASYSGIKMEKADDFDFNNSFGDISIKEVGKIDAKISYSSGSIGLLKESGNLKLDFSGDFKLGSLGRNVKELDIKANYSPVALDLDDNVTYDFDVKAHYGDFEYPKDKGISFSRNTETEKKNSYSFNPTKYYSGKVGKGSSNCKITVDSNFSTVKLK
ncbi:DUF4097 family beta strand repeat-containing protein [Emticicia sp. 17c]|uniref:DUF4097 family beta strand repeat-containing protein n=1 Tax=Emticicia sp. 17c TaxID=3127704 RepID=UPI00301C6C77